jgi:signal transduction histidine kinase
LLDSKNIALNYQPGDDAVLSLINDSLEMVLNNLLSNAIKYTPTGGKISITTTIDKKNAVIAVTDTGIGISLENQKIVFNRFTRAKETHDENIPGAGCIPSSYASTK